jgi:hypothetical protein
MPEEQMTDLPDATGEAFKDFPHVPIASSIRPPTPPWRTRIVFGCVAACVIGMLAIYLSRPTTHVDPNAPRVVAEVNGMHCPLQCGLRVQAALHTLPFVLPGSVSANPKTGVVTFAVTRAEAVDADQVRQAIEKVGFGVRAINLPAASNRDQGNAQTVRNE